MGCGGSMEAPKRAMDLWLCIQPGVVYLPRMTSRPDDKELARSLEGDAERFPDERGELLLEAGGLWLQAGDHARAIDLFEQVVVIGGRGR